MTDITMPPLLRSLGPAITSAIARSPVLQHGAVLALSPWRSPRSSNNWLLFAMYHQIRASQRSAFARQLEYLNEFADFVSIDDAVAMITDDAPVNGRHICLTFDDGYADTFDNAFPILAERDVPAVVYVIPALIDRQIAGRSLHPNRPQPTDSAGFNSAPLLSWDTCRLMQADGVTIGSHSMTHRNLAELDLAEARAELAASKRRIEEELGVPCRHFACPWGQPDSCYLPARDPALAQEVGYETFATTLRGKATNDTDLYALPRHRFEPGWGLHRLRYYCS